MQTQTETTSQPKQNAIVHKLLPPMPARIAKLPRDERGYPVPWFVAWVDGKPVFPVADGSKFRRALRENLCWVCGQKNDDMLAFVIGPMCGINRTSSEPPCHVTCATFSAQACPFLTKPKMGRMDCSNTGAVDPAGVMLTRNPGCCAVWITKSYEVFPCDNGVLIRIGDPRLIHWFAEGRQATREEVEESIRMGLPALQKMADEEGVEAMAGLLRAEKEFRKHLPAA